MQISGATSETTDRINRNINEALNQNNKAWGQSLEFMWKMEEDADRNRVLEIQEERNDILRDWVESGDESSDNNSSRVRVDRGGNLILPNFLD